MTPEQCQKSVIEQLEQLTDKKVLLADEPSLTSHATLKLAGPSDAGHVFRYRSNLKQHLPYLVASQCRLQLRILQTPAEYQFGVASVKSLNTEIRELAVARLRKNEITLDTPALDRLVVVIICDMLSLAAKPLVCSSCRSANSNTGRPI